MTEHDKQIIDAGRELREAASRCASAMQAVEVAMRRVEELRRVEEAAHAERAAAEKRLRDIAAGADEVMSVTSRVRNL
jgi:SHS2 domain-containing protein